MLLPYQMYVYSWVIHDIRLLNIYYKGDQADNVVFLNLQICEGSATRL